MALIDRRVLIGAPPEAIWGVLGDLAALSRWHVNCKQSSILTTFSRGVGARRRNFMKNGPDTVEEIVSWYENLGYEYRVVDGLPFRRNLGRLRLQAIPEGTIVQWTFDYQLGGLLGGLRDRLFFHRRLDHEIADSLKQLKRLVESSGARMDATTRDKVSMRPAPSASERAARAARAQQSAASPQAGEATTTSAPSLLPPDAAPERPRQPAPVAFEDDLPPLPGIDEPPLSDEDTKPTGQTASGNAPRPAAEPPETPAAMSQGMPLPEPDSAKADTQPVSPPSAEQPPALQDVPPPPLAAPQPPPEAEEPLPEAPSPTPSDRTHPSLPVVEASRAQARREPPPAPSAEASSPPFAGAAEPPATPPQPSGHDPVGPSIWEVFGLQPPGKAAGQQDAPAPSPSAPTAPAIRAVKPGLSAVKQPAGWRARRNGPNSLIHCRPARTHPGLRRQLACRAVGARQR